MPENEWWREFLRDAGLPADCRPVPVAGGSIASSWRLEASGRRWFLKLMPPGDTLAAEADGLRALAEAGTLRVPQVRGKGRHAGYDWLLLEWLALEAPAGGAWRRLGEGLAVLHGQARQGFGWHRDNFIGSTPQPNRPESGWTDFFREQRLGHQTRLARDKGLDGATLGTLESLMENLDALIPAGVEPSLLHGDLWSGNIAAVGGEPVIFDPAVYCGHSEADLAMMELFGAPPPEFRAAYQACRAIDPGYELRRDLYNLYHLLNHFNLFGGGYGARAGQVARALLAEVGR